MYIFHILHIIGVFIFKYICLYICPNEVMFKEELRRVLFQFFPPVPFDDGDVFLLL